MKNLLIVSAVLMLGCGSGADFTGSSEPGGQAGSGGSAGTGGSDGGSAGSGGEGGACIPKTCTTLAVEADAGSACGKAPDGCGVNYLDCGDCPNPLANRDISCGGQNVASDGTISSGVANICGTGCVQIASVACTSTGMLPYQCPDPSDNMLKPPFGGTKGQQCIPGGNGLWCCPQM